VALRLGLGLERMSEEALDALAGVWVAYLGRIGHTLAMGVEICSNPT
jgi:hypothetical protein